MAPGSELVFRELEAGDLDRVAAIYRAADPEDAEDAVREIRGSPGDRYVIARGNEVVGVTGFRPVPDTDRSYWLGWTAVDPFLGEQEAGNLLVTSLIERVRERGGRKLFAMVGDSDSAPEAGRQYGGAQAFYQGLGFRVEVRHRNYYAPGDAVAVLGLRLAAPVPPEGPLEDPGPLVVTDSDEIPETDDAYYIDWEYAEPGRGSTREEIEGWLAKIREWEGRVAFVGLPENSQSAISQLVEAGFREEGRLADLIEDGVDEVRYRYDIL